MCKSSAFKNKTALLCWSNLQLINCLNYTYNTSEDVDLFVQQGLDRNGKLIKNLRATSIFSNIFVYDTSQWHYSRIKVIIRTIIDCIKKNEFHNFIKDNLRSKFDFYHLYFMTQNYIKTSNMIVDGNYSSEIRRYNKILAPWADELTFQLRISNKNSEIILLEDGIGSYVTDMFCIRFNPDIPKWCNRLDIDINTLKPSTLILSGNTIPVDCKYKTELLRPIRGNFELIDRLNSIFEYKHYEKYNKFRFIYLTQPYTSDYKSLSSDLEHLDHTEKQILEALKKNINNCIIRPHPRDIDRVKNTFNEFPLDSDYNVWELLCLNDITENHVLIGSLTTAQFTPKWWYDMEPYIIFTYDLLIGGCSFYNENCIKNALKLKASYRNPEKVFLVKNISELILAIEQIKNK